jgi:predicted ATPase
MEQQMLRFLHGKLVLLILDNVEQLVDHAPRLVQMLESAPNVRVIATSRVRLGILGEVTFPVEALAVPNEGGRDLAALSETGSVKLFVYSAQRVVHDFRLSEANAADVVGICRRVEGMPLALLLAAAWSDVLSPAEILDRLTGEVLHEGDRPIDFLSAEWSDVPSRQRSMRAVFDHSWHLMRDYEQTVLQALAVFRGGFSAEAAYFVVGATLRQIRRLVEQSLLGRLTGGRYGIHELLRQYVAEHLARVPAVERQVRDRHADYYVHLLHRWFEDAKGPRQVAALAEMDGEIDNAQAAWDWIVGQGDVAQIVQAVDGLCLYYLRRVRGEEMVYACRAVLARLDGSRLPDAVTEAQRLKVVARLLVWQSEIVSDAEAGEAVDSAQAALSSPALSGVDVRVERGRALRLQADLLLNTDRRRSLALYREALGVLREVGDRWEASRVLYSLVTLTLRLADFAATQEYSEDLRRIGRSLGDLHALAYALEGLSNIALYEGRLEEASRIAEEGLDVRRELGVPLMIGVGLETLALRRLLSGRLDLALPLYDESLAIQDRLGLPAPYPRGVKAWGFMLAGDYDEARALVQRALDESHLTGERRLIAWNEQVVGSLTFVTGAVEDALEWLVHSADEFRALREPAFLGMGLSFLGYAHRAAGDRDRARACYVEALHMGVKSGVSPILACALPGMAMLYADAGRAERAQALITVVTQCCLFVVASKWFADVAGPEYRHAMAALSSEQVSEAEQSVLLSDMRTEALAVLVEVEAGTAP